MIIALILLAISLSYWVIIAVLAVRFGGPSPAPGGGFRLPRVSILKPVKDLDEGSDENLESFYSLNYPDMEILFGVDALDTPVTAAIEAVARRHPQVPTRIIATGTDKPLNPKIATLARMAPQATGSFWWVSDFNTRVEPDALMRLMHEASVHGSHLVFSPIIGAGGENIPALVENAYINSFVSGSVLLAWRVFHKPVIVGKSMFIDKAALIALGGFERFAEYLAEDYVMGRVFKRAGFQVTTNYTWITNHHCTGTLSRFAGRASRWAKMRWRMEPVYYLIEVLVNPIAISLFAAPFLGRYALAYFMCAWMGKTLLELAAALAIAPRDTMRPRAMAVFPLVVLVKDLIVLGVFFVPFMTGRVTWRGVRIRLGAEGRIIS